MKNVSDASAGTKSLWRHDHLPSSGMDAWAAKLQPATLEHPEADSLEQFLAGLSKNGPMEKDSIAQVAFGVLLENEEYDVFVEAFTQYQKIQAQAHAGDPGGYRRVLELCLPADWVPKDLDVMRAAFEKIQVDVLRIGIRDEATAPEATSHAVATLLRRGLAELQIDAFLSHPLAVEEALKNCCLESIVLGGKELDDLSLRPEVLAVFQIVLGGLAGCKSLKKLEILHHDLFALHASVAALLQHTNGPRLEVVALHSCDWGASASEEHLKPFMGVLRQVPTLSSVVVSAVVSNPHILKKVLEPLRGHPSLTHLTVHVIGTLKIGEKSDCFVPEVLACASTCPQVNHVGLSIPDDSGDAAHVMRSFQTKGGVYYLPSTLENVRSSFAQLRHLKSLKFSGVLLTPGIAQEMAKGIEKNPSFQSLDVADCRSDLKSRLRFLEVFMAHESMQHLQLLDSQKNVCLLGAYGGIYAFKGKQLRNLEGVPLPFELDFANAEGHQKRLTEAALEELREPTDRMLEDLESTNWKRRETRVANFMQTALLSAPGGYEQNFAEVAPMVLQGLRGTKDLKTVVRLNEVSKPRASTTTTTTAATTTTTTTTAATTTTTTTSTAATTTGSTASTADSVRQNREPDAPSPPLG